MDIEQKMQLLNNLVDYFSFDELKSLCFKLNVDWENLPHETKPALARAVVGYFQTQSREFELIQALRDERPNINFSIFEGQITGRFLPALPPRGEIPNPGLLPINSRMPYLRNAVFTGREQDLAIIADMLIYADNGSEGIFRPVAVYGMGGSGKTQLAVEFCYRYGRWLDGIHWISAENESGIASEIVSCGKAMALSNWPEKFEDQLEVTLRIWVNSPHRLIVFDGLNETDSLQDWLPRLTGVRILITTLRPNWPRHLGIEVYQLKVLEKNHSHDLLRRLSPRLVIEDDEELDRLANKMGYLPLALHLAGCYLDACSLSISGYLNEIEQAGSVLIHESQRDWITESPTGHSANLEATFWVSWKRLQGNELSENIARMIFQAVGYFAPNTLISSELIRKILEFDDVEPTSYDFAIRKLTDLGLLTPSEGGWNIHPLLAQFSRQTGEDPEKILTVIVFAFLNVSSILFDQVDYQQLSQMNPHMEATARFAEEAKLPMLIDLWIRIGIFYHEVQANYQQALNTYIRAVEYIEAMFGNQSPLLSVFLNNLGTVLLEIDEVDKAKYFIKRGLIISKRIYGPEHSNVVNCLVNLAGVWERKGENVRAKVCTEYAIKIGEKNYGQNHPFIAMCLNNLGGIFMNLGDLDKSMECFERSYAIDEKFLDPKHPYFAIRLANIGNVLLRKGDAKGAQQAFERSVEIAINAYGHDHPELAKYLVYLGNVHVMQGKLDSGNTFFLRALDILMGNLPANHQKILDIQFNIKSTKRLIETKDPLKKPEDAAE